MAPWRAYWSPQQSLDYCAASAGRSRTVQKLACAELSGGAVIVIKNSAEAASASNESVVIGETAIRNDE
ncbi:MAG: hypothetical protein JWO80_4690 [Bryobacterales bacterium]|nr:hypothetical protein [Bryobacterales bacterium]